MKRLTCLLLACLTALALTACGAEKPQEISLFAMDTYMTLAAYGDSADEALTAASREINRLEATLSRTIDTSDVSRLNAGEAVVVQPETRALLERALTLSGETAPIQGGFILKDGNVEVNCAFDTLVRLQKAETAGQVAQRLFG